MPGGAGGADVDVVTAGAGDVLKGKVIVDKNGNPLTGTLELTGTAADSHVLSGYTYYNTDPKTKRNGGMTNQGAKTASLNCGGSYTIPAGYHNGAGKVTANSLAAQTGGATAGDTDVRKGKTYWKDGTKRTGTMSEKAAATITPGTSNQSISANQFLVGAQTIKGDTNLAAANIISGKSIFGVAGSAKVYKELTFTVTSSAGNKAFSGITCPYIQYGSIGFTPKSLVAYTDDANLGMSTIFTVYQNLSYLMMTDPQRSEYHGVKFAAISSPAYLNANGFLLPVFRGSKSYRVWITGYA